MYLLCECNNSLAISNENTNAYILETLRTLEIKTQQRAEGLWKRFAMRVCELDSSMVRPRYDWNESAFCKTVEFTSVDSEEPRYPG